MAANKCGRQMSHKRGAEIRDTKRHDLKQVKVYQNHLLNFVPGSHSV
jgi:hypothetical protein